MIIRLTQNGIISQPVSRVVVGKYFSRSSVLSGHPRVLNGQILSTMAKCGLGDMLTMNVTTLLDDGPEL